MPVCKEPHHHQQHLPSFEIWVRSHVSVMLSLKEFLEPSDLSFGKHFTQIIPGPSQNKANITLSISQMKKKIVQRGFDLRLHFQIQMSLYSTHDSQPVATSFLCNIELPQLNSVKQTFLNYPPSLYFLSSSFACQCGLKVFRFHQSLISVQRLETKSRIR